MLPVLCNSHLPRICEHAMILDFGTDSISGHRGQGCGTFMFVPMQQNIALHISHDKVVNGRGYVLILSIYYSHTVAV